MSSQVSSSQSSTTQSSHSELPSYTSKWALPLKFSEILSEVDELFKENPDLQGISSLITVYLIHYNYEGIIFLQKETNGLKEAETTIKTVNNFFLTSGIFKDARKEWL